MSQSEQRKADRLKWETPKLSLAGIAADVRGGGGKLSPVGGDPGENRKQQPIG